MRALLTLPLDPARPAQAVDHLLQALGGQPPQAVGEWSVARRLAALLELRLAHGPALESASLRCAACGERFEVGFDLAACRAPVREEPVAVETPRGPRTAALPTGRQQVRWQAQGTALADVAADLMPGDDPADAATIDALDRALAARDPLRVLPLAADCPGCGEPVRHALDLEVHLVQGFARAQRALLSDIAALAAAFGWSEDAILDLPAWRRAAYLQGLEGGR